MFMLLTRTKYSLPMSDLFSSWWHGNYCKTHGKSDKAAGLTTHSVKFTLYPPEWLSHFTVIDVMVLTLAFALDKWLNTKNKKWENCKNENLMYKKLYWNVWLREMHCSDDCVFGLVRVPKSTKHMVSWNTTSADRTQWWWMLLTCHWQRACMGKALISQKMS